MFMKRDRNSAKVISVTDFSRSNERISNVSFSVDSQRQSREGETNLFSISENSSNPIQHHSERSSFRNIDSQNGLSGNNSRSETFSYARSKTSLSQYSLPTAENLVLRDLLSDVNVACVPSEARVLALKNLLKEFDEHPLPDYDFELLHGALNIVYQKLAVGMKSLSITASRVSSSFVHYVNVFLFLLFFFLPPNTSKNKQPSTVHQSHRRRTSPFV
jgi:hypothetical protein